MGASVTISVLLRGATHSLPHGRGHRLAIGGLYLGRTSAAHATRSVADHRGPYVHGTKTRRDGCTWRAMLNAVCVLAKRSTVPAARRPGTSQTLRARFQCVYAVLDVPLPHATRFRAGD